MQKNARKQKAKLAIQKVKQVGNDGNIQPRVSKRINNKQMNSEVTRQSDQAPARVSKNGKRNISLVLMHRNCSISSAFVINSDINQRKRDPPSISHRSKRIGKKKANARQQTAELAIQQVERVRSDGNIQPRVSKRIENMQMNTCKPTFAHQSVPDLIVFFF